MGDLPRASGTAVAEERVAPPRLRSAQTPKGRAEHALGPDACARAECTSVFCTMQSLHPFQRHSLESDACFRASIFSTRALEFGLEL